MKMALRCVAFAVIMIVAGCTHDSPSAGLLAIDQDFTKAAGRVVAYEALPPCSATVTANCRDQAVVDALKADVNDGDAKLDAAWKTLASADIATAGAARDTLKADLTKNHVQ